MEVVGESAYQAQLELICGGKSAQSAELEKTAILLMEDDNSYDDKAVAVMIGGLTVGYLSRADARGLRKAAARVNADITFVKCAAEIIGGWKNDRTEGSFGVRLDAVTPFSVQA